MEEWRNGEMEKWRNRGMEEWRNGGMEQIGDLRNGKKGENEDDGSDWEGIVENEQRRKITFPIS